jgi:predicted nucleic acid-binding protein
VSVPYVIDPSALMQAYLADTYSSNVTALLNLLKADDPPELHFLEMGLVEATNVLWKHVRFHNLASDNAQKILRNLLSLPLTLHTVDDYLQDALAIGLENQLAVYDSLYIALAKRLEYSLITADAKQTKAAELAGVTIKPVTDFNPTK